MDLDGDGEDEVLINATNYFSRKMMRSHGHARHGSYSIVLLRRVVAGKVETELIAGEIHAKDESSAPNCLRDSGRARSKRRRQARGHRPLAILRRRGDHDLPLRSGENHAAVEVACGV